jgi:hypothetical protein
MKHESKRAWPSGSVAANPARFESNVAQPRRDLRQHRGRIVDDRDLGARRKMPRPPSGARRDFEQLPVGERAHALAQYFELGTPLLGLGPIGETA